MRIAIVSDIHGNLLALEAVAADIQRQSVDLVVNLGDSLSGPLLPLETAQFLIAQGWLSLAGNHERQILASATSLQCDSDQYAYSQLSTKELDWLQSLPPTARIEPDIFLCHGTPSSDLENFLETVERGLIRMAYLDEIKSRLGDENAALVACGHSHIPRSLRSHRGQLIINPGSVGRQAFSSRSPVPHVVQTGSPDARYAIVERINNCWHPALHCVPYDHGAMAELANKRGWPGWEHALGTGFSLGPWPC